MEYNNSSLDVALLWLWPKLATAALILPLAYELPYVADAALKRKKERKKKSERKSIKIEIQRTMEKK